MLPCAALGFLLICVASVSLGFCAYFAVWTRVNIPVSAQNPDETLATQARFLQGKMSVKDLRLFTLSFGKVSYEKVIFSPSFHSLFRWCCWPVCCINRGCIYLYKELNDKFGMYFLVQQPMTGKSFTLFCLKKTHAKVHPLDVVLLYSHNDLAFLNQVRKWSCCNHPDRLTKQGSRKKNWNKHVWAEGAVAMRVREARAKVLSSCSKPD